MDMNNKRTTSRKLNVYSIRSTDNGDTPGEIEKSCYTQAELDEHYKRKEKDISLMTVFKSKCFTSKKDVGQNLLSLLPIVSVLRKYERKYLLGDILSGLSSACLHFPQGLAFGLLASLAPSYGLYTSFSPVLLYMMFGTSPHMSIGTNAVIALFTSELLTENFPSGNGLSSINITNASTISSDIHLVEKASVASGAAFLIGVIILLVGITRLGFITSYLSSSFVSAFTTTAAVHIITSQIPKALGIQISPVKGAGKVVFIYVEIFKSIDTANICSVITSMICLIVLVFFKDFINEHYKNKMKMPVPIDLIVVLLATLISHFAMLHDNFSINIVGDIPVGIPVPALPTIKLNLIGNSIVLAVVVFVLNISMVRLCEAKHGYQVSNNQEFIAYGIANLVSSFFWCFPSGTAPPRTIILSTMRSKTTINGAFTAVVLLFILLLIGQYFTSLPIPTLAIMVIVAVKNLLVQIKQIPSMWRVNKYDFIIWIGTFLSGVFIDLPYAIYIGVALCFVTVVIQSQNSHSYALSKLANQDLYLDSSMYTNLSEIPNVRVFKMEASIYFATVEKFRCHLYKITGDPRKMDQHVNCDINIIEDKEGPNDAEITENDKKLYVVIDCSCVSYMDINGVSMMTMICKDYERAGLSLILVRCTRYFLNIIQKSSLSSIITPSHIFPEITDAISFIQNTNL